MNIGFYIHVNTKPKATIACLESVRKFYPDAPISMSCDNAYDFTEEAKRFKCFYKHNNRTLGYPIQPYGYKKNDILEWVDRMHEGVSNFPETDYFCMLEDDVIILSKLTIDSSWEMAGVPFQYEGQVPAIPVALLNLIENFSGKRPKTNVYNCGGGSIFKTSTFLNNYNKIIQFFNINLDHIQENIYPTIGWMDCFMCVYYYLCGADLIENKRLYNNLPTIIPFDYVVPEGTEIVHNVKDNYNV